VAAAEFLRERSGQLRLSAGSLSTAITSGRFRGSPTPSALPSRQLANSRSHSRQLAATSRVPCPSGLSLTLGG
jgi:hypothetical protein